MDKQKFTIGAFAMIFNDKQEVLLCRRPDDGLWNLPGGGVEDGESPIEAAIREVKEEVNLDIDDLKLQGIYTKPKENDIVFSFIPGKVSGDLKLSDEADKIEYFSFENIPEKFSQKQKDRIKDFIDNPEKIVIKNQYGTSSIDLLKEGKL